MEILMLENDMQADCQVVVNGRLENGIHHTLKFAVTGGKPSTSYKLTARGIFAGSNSDALDEDDAELNTKELPLPKAKLHTDKCGDGTEVIEFVEGYKFLKLVTYEALECSEDQE
jgi:hypothetical protein